MALYGHVDNFVGENKLNSVTTLTLIKSFELHVHMATVECPLRLPRSGMYELAIGGIHYIVIDRFRVVIDDDHLHIALPASGWSLLIGSPWCVCRGEQVQL